MKRFRTLIIILVIIALLAVIKIFLFPSNNARASNGKGKPGAPAVTEVTVYVVQPQKLDNKVVSSGTIVANEEAQLTAEISGKIIKLSLREGDAVKKGQLLVKINDADFQATAKKIKLQLQLAQDRVNRAKHLVEIEGISQEEYDALTNQVSTLQADLDYTEAQIAKTEIRAPFSGVVGLKYVSEGSYVTPTTRIAAIEQIDPLKIDFSVPEQYYQRISVKDPVFFTVAGLKEKLAGYVYAIEPKIDPATRTVQLRALCHNSKARVLPGSFARVDLVLKETPDALMVPTQSIVPILKGQKVYLVKGGKAKEVKVETGVRTAAKVQITSGIEQGDTIITTGVMSIRDGSSVKIIK